MQHRGKTGCNNISDRVVRDMCNVNVAANISIPEDVPAMKLEVAGAPHDGLCYLHNSL